MFRSFGFRDAPSVCASVFFTFRQLLHLLVPFAKNRCVFGDASFAVADAFMKQLLFDMLHHHSVLFFKPFFLRDKPPLISAF